MFTIPIPVFTMPIRAFTFRRSRCSRWPDPSVHDGPKSAAEGMQGRQPPRPRRHRQPAAEGLGLAFWTVKHRRNEASYFAPAAEESLQQ
jgi:hypothetical protein